MADNIQVTGLGLDSRDLRRGVRQADRELDRLERSAREAGRGVDTVERSSRLAGRSLAGMAVGIGAVAAGANGLSFLVSTNREFERLSAQLRAVEGDAESGAAAFKRIEEFAVQTPFQIEGLTEAWIRLRAVGIAPTEDLLNSFGNTAAANGRDITEFAEAVVGAITGEMERLKRFGIVARQEGDRVRFIFRGVETEVGNNADEIVEFLSRIGEVEFAGAMGEQMETINGALSNLQDNLGRAARSIGEDQGFNAELRRTVEIVRDTIGESDAFAEAIGETLTRALKAGNDGLEFMIQNSERLVSVMKVLTALVGIRLGQTAFGVTIKGAKRLTSAWETLAITGLLLKDRGKGVESILSSLGLKLTRGGVIGAGIFAATGLIAGMAGAWKRAGEEAEDAHEKFLLGEIPTTPAAAQAGLDQLGVNLRDAERRFNTQNAIFGDARQSDRIRKRARELREVARADRMRIEAQIASSKALVDTGIRDAGGLEDLVISGSATIAAAEAQQSAIEKVVESLRDEVVALEEGDEALLVRIAIPGGRRGVGDRGATPTRRPSPTS